MAEPRDQPLQELEALAHEHQHHPGALAVEAVRYSALCERAWLHWSRHALDYATARGLHQTAIGAFTPTSVSDCRQAAEAAARCPYTHA